MKQYGSERFEGDRIAQNARVDTPQAEVTDDGDHGGASFLVIATHQYITIEGVIGVAQMVRADVMKGCDQSSIITEYCLGLEGC